MATSSSSDYSRNRDQISTDALKLLGVVGSGETATSNDLSDCSNALNRMVKSWQAQGIHLWKESEATIAVVADQYLYTLNASNYPTIGRPIQLLDCRYQYSSGLERKMKKMGRAEYNAMPTKTTSEGASTAFYYSPQLASGLLYVWPVPQDTTDYLAITYIKQIEDFDSASDDADFPQEWLDCLTWNLAVRIAPMFGIVISKANPDIAVMAAHLLTELSAWDSEEGSVRITPNYRNE